jgi:hypothetical protein
MLLDDAGMTRRPPPPFKGCIHLTVDRARVHLFVRIRPRAHGEGVFIRLKNRWQTEPTKRFAARGPAPGREAFHPERHFKAMEAARV